MNLRIKPGQPDGDASITLDDLIKAYTLQKLVTDATLETLCEAKRIQEELSFYREREVARLEQQLKQGDANNADI